jgi:hypothetical protein
MKRALLPFVIVLLMVAPVCASEYEDTWWHYLDPYEHEIVRFHTGFCNLSLLATLENGISFNFIILNESDYKTWLENRSVSTLYNMSSVDEVNITLVIEQYEEWGLIFENPTNESVVVKVITVTSDEVAVTERTTITTTTSITTSNTTTNSTTELLQEQEQLTVGITMGSVVTVAAITAFIVSKRSGY